jgi:hypothetical protein
VFPDDQTKIFFLDFNLGYVALGNELEHFSKVFQIHVDSSRFCGCDINATRQSQLVDACVYRQ